MATMTISLPDPIKDWVERRVSQGEYAGASDYMRDLIRRDRERRAAPELTMDDLRQIVSESLASGDSNKPLQAIIHEGDRIARARGVMRD